jgi:hypothetical protein
MMGNRKMRPPLLVLLLIAWVGGCQSTGSIDSSLSYIEPVPSVDAAELGSAIATTVAEFWPAARTAILLIPPAKGETPNALTEALTAGLLNSGFAVVVPEAATTETTHRLQYWVTSLDGNALVRLQLDDSRRARLYTQDAKGGVVALSPMTVRN